MEEIIKIGNSLFTKETINLHLSNLLDKVASVEIHKYIDTPTGAKMTVDFTALHDVKEEVMKICLIMKKLKGTGLISHTNVIKASTLYAAYYM